MNDEVMETVEVAEVAEVVVTPVVAEPVPVLSVAELLKTADVTALLEAKQTVEDFLAARIDLEYERMKANAAAIAKATNTPIEKVLEVLMPKPEKRVRKLTAVVNDKPERVKYRHPQNEELTWSGRGKQPGWLTHALTEFDEQDLLAA